MTESNSYDALIVVSFGGPDGPDDVMPFLANVLRGRNVPRERMLEVAEHYYRFGGISPINSQNRALAAAVRAELTSRGRDLPVYLGNRNWHPLLAETLGDMRDAGIKRAVGFVTSAYGSYSGCRQYLDDIERARQAVGPGAPVVDKLRLFYNHPGFVAAVADGLRTTLATAGPGALVLFSAHSIPISMAAASPYEQQLRTTAGLVAAQSGVAEWKLVFQSRSGPPGQPWLEPDVGDQLRALAARSGPVVICPIGFVSDHMEVVYDLDTEAKALAGELGIQLLRAPTAGTHPRFVSMIGDLVDERLDPGVERAALGPEGPWGDLCPAGCCPPPARPAAR